MEPIKEYRVVSDEEYISFFDKMNKLVQESWEPVGGVSITPKGYSQAMVKR